MRDPARIDEVLALVKEAWEKYPDLRLAQLIGNVAEYYTEDDKLSQAMIKIYELENPCPYTFAHTQLFCGVRTCREA